VSHQPLFYPVVILLGASAVFGLVTIFPSTTKYPKKNGLLTIFPRRTKYPKKEKEEQRESMIFHEDIVKKTKDTKDISGRVQL